METVTRIKRILEANTANAEVLEEALTQLREVEMTPEILVATGISRVVADIRRHTRDLEVEYIATILYRNWRRMFRDRLYRPEVTSSD